MHVLQLSPDGKVMASAETTQRGSVIIWNLSEGKRVATFKPHTNGVVALAFNSDSTLIVTAGTDSQRRVQVIVWNVQSLMTQSPSLSIIAKQICEFPISKIRFIPYQDASLLACGRENVRFFRVRKAHLPACPVILNEFARGFTFTDFAFSPHTEAEALLSSVTPCAFFASNRGVLLKINCAKKTVVCAYQLHSGAIRSLTMYAGYAVTGGADSRLRIWPLDFSDFLLEAQHEAAVTSVCLSSDGRKLSVGTAAGTLGVLDVVEHR